MLEVTCALLIQDQKVLIAQRSEYMSLPFLWEFPGGKLKPGETYETCIHREIDEELRVEIELFEQLEPCVYTYPDKAICLIPFIATIKQGKPTLTEHLAFAWVDKENIEEYVLAPADEQVWSRYLQFVAEKN